jgi:AraC-like DNA-binding protein
MADLPPSPAPVDFEFLCGAYPLEHGRAPALLRHLPDVVAFPLGADQRSVVELLRAEYTEPGPGSEARRAALIDVVLVAILRRLAPDQPTSTDPGIAGALREIHGRPERAWTVQQLGAVAGMSRTTFIRRFTAVLGAPPMRYLTDWRLRSAARLLQQSDDPLSAIARRVGYANEFAFATAFRRKYGVPPGRYRHSGQGQS